MRKANIGGTQLTEKGRVLNGGNETAVRQAMNLLTSVLASLQGKSKKAAAKADNTDEETADEETPKPKDTKAREAGGFSVNDAHTIIRDAITALVGDEIAYGEYGYNRVQIEDLFDTAVVYRLGWQGDLYQTEYAISDDGIVSLGVPFIVIRKVTYLPAGDGAISTSTPASETPADDSDDEVSEAATIPVEGDAIRLIERAVSADGTAMLKLIAPGWGSSGYYPADVLRRDGPQVFKAGLHNFIDHPTPTEESQRPEGSIDRVGSVLVENAQWRDDYAGNGPGLYARAKVKPGFANDLDAIAENIGMSIRANGKGRKGNADGREGVIIEAITDARSVDYVTLPGAGGKVVSLLESARAQRGETMPADNNELAALRETVTQLQASARLMEARNTITRTLTEYAGSIPQPVLDRLAGTLERGALPLTEAGAVNHPALIENARNAVRDEIAYLQQSGARFGMPRDLGGNGGETHDAPNVDTLANALQALGMSESAARAGAVGRE